MANEGITFEIEADTKRLDAALKKIEQSTDGLAKKLDTGFGLLDARIGLLRRRLVAVQDQVGRSGNALSSFLKILGASFGIGAIEEAGEGLAKLSNESAQAQENIDKFFKMDSRALLKTFNELESQVVTLRAATEGQLSVFGTNEDIAAILARQEQLVRGLEKQVVGYRNNLKNAIRLETALAPNLPNADFENKGPSIEARRILDETLKTLRDIAELAKDPKVKSLIEGVLDLQRLPRQQRGALEPRIPREIQVASLEVGSVSASDSVNGLAAAQTSLTIAAEQSTRSLDEQAGTIRNLDGAARDLGFTFASSFEDAVVEGRTLSDVLQGLEQDVLRILTRKLVTEPLAGAVTGLIGSSVGALAGQFHGGGRVGSTPVPGRVVPASFFAGAPRFAGGGMIGRVPRLAPGEVPAILHRGEVVRTPAQEAALRRNGGGASATPIVVNIQTPNPRAFNESRGQIQAMLADAVSAGRRNR